MKTQRALYILVGSLTLAVFSEITPAQNCSSLRGTWQTYGGPFIPEQGFPTYWDCTYILDSSGQIEIGNSACEFDLVGEGAPSGFPPQGAAGQLITDSQCDITGTISVGGNLVTVEVLSGTMNQKRDTINGVQVITFDPGGPLPISIQHTNFTMVKIGN